MGCPILYCKQNYTQKEFILFSYDNAGNPISYKGATLTWTNGRQLASYSGSISNNVTYKYDYAGIRTQKTVGSTVTNYFLDGSQILAEKTGSSLIWYYYDESGICGMRYNNVDYIFEKNILGDVLAIYNMQTGQKIGEYTYDAWGNILTQTDNAVMNANPFRYRGYYYDKETGLYYLNSRYYDPETGRFINADNPLNLFTESQMPFGANLYQYCYNNPVMYTDPTGEGFWTWLKGAVNSTVGKVVLTVVSAAMFVGGAALVLTGNVNLGFGLMGAGIGSAIGTWTASNALAGFTLGAAAGGLIGFTLGAGANMLFAGGSATTFISASLVTFVGVPLVGAAAVGLYKGVMKDTLDKWDSMSLLEKQAMMNTTGIRSPFSTATSFSLTILSKIRFLYS